MGKITGFFQEVKSEFHKVVFPKRDELVGSTWVVIISVLIMSLYLGIVDLSLSRLVGYLLR
jgi:preprotein translocase subunit SecE